MVMRMTIAVVVRVTVVSPADEASFDALCSVDDSSPRPGRLLEAPKPALK